MKNLSRLLQLKEDTRQAGEEMNDERSRFDRLRGSGAPRVVVSFNLFQTPEDIADRMAALMPRGGDILEPSAGLGRLYSAVRRSGNTNKITLVDNSPACMGELYHLTNGDNVELIQRDFLTVTGRTFAAVIMNPPFKRGLDVKHIKHALTLLAPGGVLVALCYNGVKQNRELRPIAATWEVLPDGSFKSEGTTASVVLLTLTKGGIEWK